MEGARHSSLKLQWRLALTHALTQAQGALDGARYRRDEEIRAAAVAGMSRREIAEAVGLSHQRVTQIINEGSSDGSVFD